MMFLDAMDAIKTLREQGIDIVRCSDCKRSQYIKDRYYCWDRDVFVDSDFFCKKSKQKDEDE